MANSGPSQRPSGRPSVGFERPSAADTVGLREGNIPRYADVTVSGQEVRGIWPGLERLVPEEFDREDWTDEHAILWIRYRSPLLFHFISDFPADAREPAAFSRARYTHPDPEKELLKALQTDKLRAILNGQKLSPDYWYGRSLPDRPEGRRTHFRRQDLLKLWKPLEGGEDLRERIGVLLEELKTGLGRRPSEKAAHDFLKARDDCKRVTLRMVREWIHASWGQGKQGRRKVGQGRLPASDREKRRSVRISTPAGIKARKSDANSNLPRSSAYLVSHLLSDLNRVLSTKSDARSDAGPPKVFFNHFDSDKSPFLSPARHDSSGFRRQTCST